MMNEQERLENAIKNDRRIREQMTRWFKITGDTIDYLIVKDYEPTEVIKFMKRLLRVDNLKYFR